MAGDKGVQRADFFKDILEAVQSRHEGSRAQASVELVSYLGLFILATGVAVAYVYPQWETSSRLGEAQATVGNVKDAVERVYGAGPGARQTITIRIPDGVKRSQASLARVMLSVDVGSGVADVVEATEVPMKGGIPTRQGTYRLPVEYLRSGYVVVGSGLRIEPSEVDVNATAGNATSIVLNVGNDAGRNFTDVRVGFEGGASPWLASNETSFSLESGQSRSILVIVRVPHDALPQRHQAYAHAESEDAFAQSEIGVRVAGALCGDGILEGSEECEPRLPFMLPDADNPDCLNPSPSVGGIRCDEPTRRYVVYDEFGLCDSGCRCEADPPAWIVCGAGCLDQNYCNNCDHCRDGAANCGESIADGGGACSVCDGLDDIAEGYQCSAGEISPCGSPDCAGTKSCIANGSGCQWSRCSSVGSECSAKKCCTCGGDSGNPGPVFDPTHLSDCTPWADAIQCGEPSSCRGGLYRGKCVGLDVCGPDMDQSTWNASLSWEVCAGAQCRQTHGECSDAVYPCHGRTTVYACAAAGACLGAVNDDSSACGNISSCIPAQSAILSKLDAGWTDDYVDSPSSHFGYGFPVNYHVADGGRLVDVCPSAESGFDFSSSVYYPDPGAYAPYRNGLLHIYAKAGTIDAYESMRLSRWIIHDVTWVRGGSGCVGNRIRIGNDAAAYFEYAGPEPTWSGGGWQRYTVNLSSPLRVVGRPDWNGSIGFLQLRWVAYSFDGYSAGDSLLWEDIAYLEK